jgi:hypothetical protein
VSLASAGLCDCPRDRLCPPCLERTVYWLGGGARVWGGRWAESVADRRPELLARPWPPAEGRAREIALHKLAQLSRDPRALEVLLERHQEGAERAWARLQAMPAEELARWRYHQAVDRQREARRVARERARAGRAR